eukprot:1056249-Rhodomonas_salina.2
MVASFRVTVALSEDDACLPEAGLQSSLRGMLEDQVAQSGSAHYAVLVTSMVVNLFNVDCDALRRSVGKEGRGGGTTRGLLQEAPSGPHAVVTMLVVFQSAESVVFDMDLFVAADEILQVTPLSVSSEVIVDGAGDGGDGDVTEGDDDDDENDIPPGCAMVDSTTTEACIEDLGEQPAANSAAVCTFYEDLVKCMPA